VRVVWIFMMAAAAVGVVEAQLTTVIREVTLIDGSGAAPLERAVLVLRGDRIVSVGVEGEVRVPAGAREVRLPGRYVVPGFIDMHAHVAMGPVLQDSSSPGGRGFRMPYDDASSREITSTLLAFGITTARNPGGPTRESVAIRDAVRLRTLDGPRIYTAGAVIDVTKWPGLTVSVSREQEVRDEVARQTAAGVDYIKLYAGLSPQLIAAGIDEAHRRGARVLAHLFATSWTDAAKAGIDGIVHIVPGNPGLLPVERRSKYLEGIRGTAFMFRWFDYVNYDGPEIADMLNALVANHVTIDPTLVVFEALARGNDTAITRHPDLALAPPVLLENWRSAFTLGIGWTPEDYAMAQRVWPRVLELVRRLFRAGVLLTVGTDVPNPWIPPGSSFHRELELLVSAGIAPLEVLSMATRNGAQALGVLSDVGTITPGKRADVGVVTGDPVADIRNTRRIEWVVQDGRWRRPAELLPRRLNEQR